MKVEVWKRYAGNRAKKPIEVGLYAEGNNKLQGLAVFLRDHGNARFIEEEVAQPVTPAEVAPEVIDEIAEDEDPHGISGTRKRKGKK